MLSLNLILIIFLFLVITFIIILFSRKKQTEVNSYVEIGEIKQLCEIVTKEVMVSDIKFYDKNLNLSEDKGKIALCSEGTALITFEIDEKEISKSESLVNPKPKIRLVDTNIKVINSKKNSNDDNFNKLQKEGLKFLEEKLQKKEDLKSHYIDFKEKIEAYFLPFKNELRLPNPDKWLESQKLVLETSAETKLLENPTTKSKTLKSASGNEEGAGFADEVF